ncbi:MAG: hypothetical protein PWR10_1681 [Halanaerobiales bacterium]|nr:hypothetical protein [Halanaerobiales bacterium]
MSNESKTVSIIGTEDMKIKKQPFRLSWSGKRDLNPRPSRWQRDALPLSYSRMVEGKGFEPL